MSNEIKDILGFEVTNVDLEKVSNLSPALTKEINKWISAGVNNPLSLQIKKCLVEIVPLDQTLEDFKSEYEDEDDPDLEKYSVATEKYKEYLSTIKKNEERCPNFRNCPLYINDAVPYGGKCPMEIMVSKHLKDGFYKEMDIQDDDFSDKIVVNHLVATELIAQRALNALANESVAKKVVTINKNGSTTYDTKINDNFIVYQKSLELAEKLRKNAILGRENKLKNKKLENELDENKIKEQLKKKMDNFNVVIDVAEIVENVANDDEFQSIEG